MVYSSEILQAFSIDRKGSIIARPNGWEQTGHGRDIGLLQDYPTMTVIKESLRDCRRLT